MANFSDYIESQILNHVFRTNTFSKPTTIAIALTRIPPSDGSTGSTIDEPPQGDNYRRAFLGVPRDELWTGVNGSPLASIIYNLSGLTFPTCQNNAWGWVSGVAIVDASGYAQGNVLFHGTLTIPKNVGVGDTFSFASGNVSVETR